MTKKYLTYDTNHLNFEIAWNPVFVLVDQEPQILDLVTLVNITHGLLVDAAIGEDGFHLDLMVELGLDLYNDCHLTITVPTPDHVADAVLVRMSMPPDAVIHRHNSGAHPVHEAIIKALMWTPDGSPADLSVIKDRWFDTFDELAVCSAYEHTFEFVRGVGYGPEAHYAQPRKGDDGDPHAAHVFDPWCCGVARLQALQTLRLTSPNRGQAGLDASNGA